MPCCRRDDETGTRAPYPGDVSVPAPPALIGALDVLRCPQCGATLELVQRSLRCPQRHTYDLARAGYVSLLRGNGAISGDDDEMARARERFLASGAYRPLLEAITDLAADTVPALNAAAPPPAGSTVSEGVGGSDRAGSRVPTVLDAGCGPGYYLSGMLDRFPTARGIGFDTSARSLRFAARSHARAAVHSGDVFAPFPLADGSVDALLDVFAPRNPAEFVRVLHPEGRLIVARPAAEHLAELRALVPGMVAVDPQKEERLHAALDPHFDLETQRTVRCAVPLDAASARDLVAMTPSARHIDAAALPERLEALENSPSATPFTVTLSVLLSSHRPR